VHLFIYGFHTLTAMLNANMSVIKKIFYLTGRKDQRIHTIVELARSQNIEVTPKSRAELDALLGGRFPHQGIIAQCSDFSGFKEALLPEIIAETMGPKLFLVLDGVQDPHNLGSSLRSANAFGAQAVIAPKDRACALTPVVRKVASGAAFITPFIQVTNLSRTLNWLKEQGIWIVGLAGDADLPLSEIDLKGDIALVMGSEGQGMRKLTQKNCDYLAKIPLTGTVESLNVSVATAVSLYEAVRQRDVPFSYRKI
jgi:23S rRNA (guanosine2251-2'-O)-methyltransferase